MRKSYLLLALALGIQQFSAQTISSKKWNDLFSYNNILSIKEDKGTLIAATENGIFYYNTSSGEIRKLSKANGLHEVKITAFDYNPTTQIGLVGYANGSMDVIGPDGISYIVDIPIATGFTGNKRINHINISGNLAVISVNYGVSIFKLDKKEFAQSAFFVNNGIFEAAREASIKNDKVYVATATGLKYHDINVTFPVYNTWTTLLNGDFTQADSENYAVVSTPNTVYFESGGVFSPIAQNFVEIKDVVATDQNIVVTDKQRVYVFSNTGQYQSTPDFGEDCNTASFVGNKIFGGTPNSGVKDESKMQYKPDGPYKNTSYKMSLLGNQIWVASGGLSSYAGAIERNLGYYHFDGNQWNYPQYFVNNPKKFNVLDVVANPQNPTEVYFTNYIFAAGDKGIYKMEGNEFKKQYKGDDSNQYYNRPVGIAFDEDNKMFVSVTTIENSPATTGYYYYNAAADDFTLVPLIKSGGVLKPLVKDGYLFMPCPYFGDGGLIINKYGNNPSMAGPNTIIKTENNLPVNGTVSAALDNDEDLWIGTREGLRILSNPTSAISDTGIQTQPVVIMQNGIPEESFRNNTILQIAVDSGNHKWVSVDGGGVYYLSANGEQTLKHFTKENSPLPTNSVTDIQIDHKTGKVYFVSLDGIVVYQSDAIDVNSNFGNVLVYPNPVVYAQYKGNVTFRGLAMKTNIRIADVAGNLVHQGIARGGFYEWNLNNQRGNRVASGVYFVLMTNEDGTDKATAKIAVVN
ncbi:hypothetical protein [Amniculibacterium sp. G2-70]|uniref:type IX secretion system anionic LPS delivery protein PorZ n=1 Tax=Amniculibacterium sp. G2-70 TaxID=2767188 RepID=UPI001654A052|nr:hypothetical protein [Amniculibacterium sp. G2-70]